MLCFPVLQAADTIAIGSYLPPSNFQFAHDWSPALPIMRCSTHPLAFGTAPLQEFQTLVRRLGAEHFKSVYLLLGQSGERLVARGGKTKNLLARLGTHLGTAGLRHFTRVAVVTGEGLDDNDVAALECLLLRQIEALGVANPGSMGPELLTSTPVAWNNALTAFMFMRWALEKVRIGLLEPRSPQHPASLIVSQSGISERWAPAAFETRKNLIGERGIRRGPRLDFARGDYITIAEARGEDFWLLAGSEIRATAVASARRKDKEARSEMLNSGRAAYVRGFPDRLELLVDRKIGQSVDRLTKFVLGSAGGPKSWRPFVPTLFEAPKTAPTQAM